MPGHSFDDLKAIAASLPDKVRDAYTDLACDLVKGWIDTGLEYCESPIEQLLYLCLLSASITAETLVNHERRTTIAFALIPQRTIRTPTATYRVDFRAALVANGQEYSVLVECDGHDFHEKTKKQAAQDKARDRHLQAYGYPVLRYTGSEIWANAQACGDEVIDFLLKRAGLN